MTSSSISSRTKFVRTTTTIATIFSYSICLLLPPLASTFSPFLLLPSSISSPSSSHERSRFHSTGTEIATSPQHRNTNRNRNTQTNTRSSILTAASTAIMSSANPNNEAEPRRTSQPSMGATRNPRPPTLPIIFVHVSVWYTVPNDFAYCSRYLIRYLILYLFILWCAMRVLLMLLTSLIRRATVSPEADVDGSQSHGGVSRRHSWEC